MFDLRNAYHHKQKTYIKHSSGLHPGETFYSSLFAPFSRLNLTLHILDTLSFLYIYHRFMLIFFAFDNDDMDASKRRVILFYR